MSTLAQSLDDYLSLRRGLGYKLESVGPLLRGFVAFAERAGAVHITTELALAWASQPREASAIWSAHRLSAVRGFARYLRTLDPTTEVPPADLLPAPGYRPAPPYLYSHEDIAALLAAARRLAPPLRAATFEALVGLLAVTGMRIGEAMRLDCGDLDAGSGLIVVRDAKFGKSRLVPLHPTATRWSGPAAWPRPGRSGCRSGRPP